MSRDTCWHSVYNTHILQRGRTVLAFQHKSCISCLSYLYYAGHFNACNHVVFSLGPVWWWPHVDRNVSGYWKFLTSWRTYRCCSWWSFVFCQLDVTPFYAFHVGNLLPDAVFQQCQYGCRANSCSQYSSVIRCDLGLLSNPAAKVEVNIYAHRK